MLEKIIEKNSFEESVKKLYPKNSFDDIFKRYDTALKKFIEIFKPSHTDNLHFYSAPGRTEICGNHTDHQLGKVLAGSINCDIIGIVMPNESGIINVYCEGFKMFNVAIDNTNIDKAECGTSLSIIKGIIQKFKEHGAKITGLDIYTVSDIPVGAGLSSSAAFENLFAVIFNDIFLNNKLNKTECSVLCKEVENEYFGKPCGLMDQAACCFGGVIYIDFKDKQNPIIEPLNTDFLNNEYDLLLIDCKASHADLTDDYSDITVEMRKVAEFFNKQYLSEVNYCDLLNSIKKLRNATSDRAILRSIHYFNEVERVENARNAIKNQDTALFLEQIKQSGISSKNLLQNIYSAKSYENQSLSLGLYIAESNLKSDGVTRIHGGGFAGCIQIFCKKEITATITEIFKNIFGNDCCMFISLRSIGSTKVF